MSSILLENSSYALLESNGKVLTEDLQNYIFSVEEGLYVLSGKSADITRHFTLEILTGEYTFTGKDVILDRNYPDLIVGTGNYTFSGNDVLLVTDWLLTANTGNYTLTGKNARMYLSDGIWERRGGMATVWERRADTGNKLLLENGDFLRLENGDKIIIGLQWTPRTKVTTNWN
jgi:hypothetical protein